ncbi:MAG: S-layer y protein [Paenibacillaceae bacterium]|nr:S-layer y protein [Paenibacillaceae bacterium]
MNKMGKWAAGIAAAALLAGGSAVFYGEGVKTVAAASAPAGAVIELRDIGGHWAESAIRGAISKQYVDGYQDGTFLPDRQVSRAEFVKMAAAALKLTVSGNTTGSDWYQAYVNAAVGAGVHKWSDFASGDWSTPMKRSEMSRMAVRAAGQDTEDDLEWMYLATKAGLIQGVDATGNLDVDGTTTRAQAVTIIERILAVKEGRGEEVAKQADKRAVSRAEVLWHKTNLESMLDGDYIDVAGTPEKDRFQPKRMVAEAYNGNIKGWGEGLFIIDLDDSNDPYKHLLAEGKVYSVTRNNDSVNTSYLELPNGNAYVVLSVSTVQMIKNPDDFDLKFLGTSYLSTMFGFNYDSETLHN